MLTEFETQKYFTNLVGFMAHYNKHAKDPITPGNLSSILELVVWDVSESTKVLSDSRSLVQSEGSLEFEDLSGNPFVIYLEREQEWLVEDKILQDLLTENFEFKG